MWVAKLQGSGILKLGQVPCVKFKAQFSKEWNLETVEIWLDSDTTENLQTLSQSSFLIRRMSLLCLNSFPFVSKPYNYLTDTDVLLGTIPKPSLCSHN